MRPVRRFSVVTFDFPPFGLLDRFGLVTVARPTGLHAFAAVGFPGMMGVLGMNDAGVRGHA